jgi:hypothetical protein
MTNRQFTAELARLDAAARGAGLALVCPHQSSDEMHGALVRDYLDQRGHGASFYAIGAIMLAAFGALAIF